MPPQAQDTASSLAPRAARVRWIVALGLLAGLLAWRAALPLLLERLAEWQGSQILGRRVDIENVDLALLGGGLALDGVSIGPLVRIGSEPEPVAPEDAHLLLERLELRLGWLELLGGRIDLPELRLVAPTLTALVGLDGRLIPVVRPQPGQPQASPEEPDGEAGEPWPVRIGRLEIQDLELLYADLGNPGIAPLHLEMEQFELRDFQLAEGEISLGPVAFRGPRLRVRRDIDLSPILAGPAGDTAAEPGPAAGAMEASDDAEASAAADAAAATPPAAAPVDPEATAELAAPESPGLGYRLQEVVFEKARFDLVLGERALDVLLSVSARDVTSQPDTRFPLRVEVDFESEDGSLSLDAEVGISPPVFDGLLGWSRIDVEPLVTLADLALPVTVEQGESSGQIELRLGPDPEREGDPLDLLLSGRVSLDGLAVSAPDESLDLEWQSLEVEARSLRVPFADAEGLQPPPDLHLAAIRLASPALRLARRPAEPGESAPDSAEPAAEPSEPEPSEPAASPRLRVDALELSNGSLEVSDTSVEPRFQQQLRDLELRGRDLRWPEREVAELSLSVRGGHDTRLGLQGSRRGREGQLSLELSELPLHAFSPYSASAAGYWIEAGRVSVDAELGERDERYEVESRFALDDLDVAEVNPGSFEKEVGFPLDLALALLRDPGGRIALPVKLALEDGEANLALGSLVGAALRQALVGAITSPLKGLKLLSGGGSGPPRLAPVSAAPGDSSPDLEALAPFAEVLAARPGLSLTLHGVAGESDARVLAERQLAELALSGEELPAVEAGAPQRRRLVAWLRTRAGGEPSQPLEPEDAVLLEGWIERVEVPPQRFEALAVERAAAARDALVERYGCDPSQLLVEETHSGEPGVSIDLGPRKR